MKFTPEKYNLPDIPHQPFIDPDEINGMLQRSAPDDHELDAVIQKSLGKQRLSLQEVAVLLKAESESQIAKILQAARELKKMVYGNRIVLFAPLYVGNLCRNNCVYCGFRSGNREEVRHTLSQQELRENVDALLEEGQKRLILVYGEHERYNADYIADTVRTVYSVKNGHSNIRRVNINAAPMDHEGFAKVKDAGIGTYQIFQETYHPQAYAAHHPSGKKADYHWRLSAFDRAMEAGIDDVGMGALFGLYDWKFEVMAMVRHTNHLEACFNVGPHTISFPRLQDALQYKVRDEYRVSDEDFVRLVAILRLAVPYTGMILTAREPEEIRTKVLEFGVSQIDAGTRIGIGAYTDKSSEAADRKVQFTIHDNRSLGSVIGELLEKDYLPSFCTACYRKGRTGEHFMEFSIPGFIKRFCTPNGMLTLAEYLVDYGSETIREKGWQLIQKELDRMDEGPAKNELQNRLRSVKEGQRDLYY